jgi:hypothetical protein
MAGKKTRPPLVLFQKEAILKLPQRNEFCLAKFIRLPGSGNPHSPALPS